VTARSFFSKDNPDHPAVQENEKLRKRLSMLSSIRQAGGVQNSSTQIEEHKAQLWNEFETFKDLSTKEVQRLKRQETDIEDALSSVKMELHSQRPDSATIETNNNLTMTSNFSMHSVDVEELRQ